MREPQRITATVTDKNPTHLLTKEQFAAYFWQQLTHEQRRVLVAANKSRKGGTDAA
jgi:hypothetical protein